MSWAYSACALLFQQRAGSAVTFDSTFLFEAPPLFARVTSRTRLCHIDDRPLKLHFENFNIDYPLDLLCCEKYKCIFKFSQRDYRYSTNTKFTVRRTNTYTHTYIHIYIQTPLAFNTLMWGSLRFAPISLAPRPPSLAVLQATGSWAGVWERVLTIQWRRKDF